MAPGPAQHPVPRGPARLAAPLLRAGPLGERAPVDDGRQRERGGHDASQRRRRPHAPGLDAGTFATAVGGAGGGGEEPARLWWLTAVPSAESPRLPRPSAAQAVLKVTGRPLASYTAYERLLTEDSCEGGCGRAPVLSRPTLMANGVAAVASRGNRPSGARLRPVYGPHRLARPGESAALDRDDDQRANVAKHGQPYLPHVASPAACHHRCRRRERAPSGGRWLDHAHPRRAAPSRLPPPRSRRRLAP